MRFEWQGDLDGVAGGDGAALEDDGHDAGAGYGFAFGGGGHAGVHEAGLEVVELLAGVAEAGDFDDGFGADGERVPVGRLRRSMLAVVMFSPSRPGGWRSRWR